jgi:biotin carboxyl carrier protein
MKLKAEFAGVLYALDLRVAGSRVLAEIDGRRYDLEVHESPGGGFLLLSGGRVFDCRIEGRPETGKTIDVVVGTTRYAVTLTDPKRLRGASNAGLHSDGAARVIAPMPGKVVQVLVDIGARVEAGDGIAIVEAMKMQNEMKSPTSGTVVALNVKAGATVSGGDVLAVIE